MQMASKRSKQICADGTRFPTTLCPSLSASARLGQGVAVGVNRREFLFPHSPGVFLKSSWKMCIMKKTTGFQIISVSQSTHTGLLGPVWTGSSWGTEKGKTAMRKDPLSEDSNKIEARRTNSKLGVPLGLKNGEITDDASWEVLCSQRTQQFTHGLSWQSGLLKYGNPPECLRGVHVFHSPTTNEHLQRIHVFLTPSALSETSHWCNLPPQLLQQSSDTELLLWPFSRRKCLVKKYCSVL